METNTNIEELIEYVRDLRNKNEQLERLLSDTENRLIAESKRCSGITAAYAGMRKRLDMVFGAPNDGDPEIRQANGRSAGLEGAVNWAIAEYGRVTRLLKDNGAVK